MSRSQYPGDPPGDARSGARRAALHLLLGALATLAGWLLIVLLEAVRPTPAGGRTAPLLYMITVFPFFGFAVAEWLALAGTARRHLTVELGLLTAFAFARLLLGVPASGHIMMMAWFLLTVWRFTPRALALIEATLALVALGGYLWAKLVLWDDTFTPISGALLGAAVWASARWLERR
ncbi:MAG: hypothetical protein IV100_03070 [Myxococcales bacterium]|nr:hypothetical protein [Myxococcales bacterium]